MEPLSKIRRSLSSYSGHHSMEEWVHIPMPQEQFAPVSALECQALRAYAVVSLQKLPTTFYRSPCRMVLCCADPFIYSHKEFRYIDNKRFIVRKF